jgi:hypothetical protein
LLSLPELKNWLNREISQLDKLLLVLASLPGPMSISAIKSRASEAGLKVSSSWNPSSTLSRSKGLAIRVPDGWELTDSGTNHLRNLGLSSISPAAVKVASDLRGHLLKIKSSTTRAFVEEAIKCYEAELFRSAIVMSWIAAVDVLHRVVVKSHLISFNKEAKNANPKWKDATNEDGLGRMGEEDFLVRAAAVGVIGKNQKDELLKALKLRNGCGHPNSLKVGSNMVAGHLELLMLNVFEQFGV